jgi:ferritin-like metal-binding protein YciE
MSNDPANAESGDGNNFTVFFKLALAKRRSWLTKGYRGTQSASAGWEGTRKQEAFMAAKDTSLKGLLVHAVKDIYYAEKQILKTLPKLIEKAKHDELKSALEAHREETEEHVSRLEEVFAALDMKPSSVKCEAIEGILKEGDEVLSEFGAGPAGDAGIIFAAQAVEHYEINRYGTMVEWATELKMAPVAKLLKKTLDEEHKADTKLTALAVSGENREGIVKHAAKAA